MNFKDIATKIAQIGQFIPVYGPIFKAFIPSKLGDKYDGIVTRIEDTSTKITQILLDAQVTGEVLKLSGPDKLKMTLPKIKQLIIDSEALIGADIMDEAEFEAGAIEMTNGWNRIIKSVKRS